MIIHLSLIEQGLWWEVNVKNADNLKLILNSGEWQGTKVYAVMLLNLCGTHTCMIYDCGARRWR